MNLFELLKSQNFKGLTMPVIRKIAIQMLNTLIYMTKHKIIHCDLKPENILLRQDGKTGIKVIDFGSACYLNDKMYTYIQSRFYRAPEVILEIGYGLEIDMWSFGCILVELFTGIPIFSGENERDQLYYMIEYFGLPDSELINSSPKKCNFFDMNGNTIEIANSKGKIRKPKTKKLSKFLKGADPDFIDLIYKCFLFNPDKRIKPSEAIIHPWITYGMPKEILHFHKTKIKTTFDTNCRDESTKSVLLNIPKFSLKNNSPKLKSTLNLNVSKDNKSK